MEKPEALFLADELEAPLGTIIGAELHRRATKELRRLHATVQAREDEVLTHSAAVFEATKLLSEARTENTTLRAALASSCDEQRHQLWESGGIAGCERARAAERQRDALLEACKVALGIIGFGAEHDQISAAIAAAEGEKT